MKMRKERERKGKLERKEEKERKKESLMIFPFASFVQLNSTRPQPPFKKSSFERREKSLALNLALGFFWSRERITFALKRSFS